MIRRRMSYLKRSVLVGVACTVAASSVEALQRSKPDAAALAEQANQIMGLLASDVVELSIAARPATAFSVVVPVNGEMLTLDLRPHSARSPRYQLIAQLADGSYESVEPGPVRTFRGVVREIEGATVAGSLLEQGVMARIMLPDGEEYWVEPLAPRVAGATNEQYVVYRGVDVVAGQWRCGAAEAARQGRQFGGSPSASGAPCGGIFCLAEFAADADFEYFEDYGSVAAVEARINSVINSVNIQYERDVEITHVITGIIVRTAEPDPYTSSNNETLLNEFRAQWQANHQNIGYDLAGLFTGKEIIGNVIGTAWISAVCGSRRYGFVQSDFNGNFACATDLSAHEMGHNWNASHCNCPSFTMNPNITCANRFQPVDTIPDIISFRDSRNCLAAMGACTITADCDDGNPCTDEDCVLEICQFTNIQGPCDDQDACTLNDTCSGGVCAGGAIQCQDSDPCTRDFCVAGVCESEPIVCDDSDLCTIDACVLGDCEFVPIDCDDGDVCTDDTCLDGVCRSDPIVCDDNFACNGIESCDVETGECVTSAITDCNGNGMIDACELAGLPFLSVSGQLSPIGVGSPQFHVLDAPPETFSDVVLTFTASADLAGTNQWIDVALNGIDVGRVFESGADSCPLVPNTDELIVAADIYNPLRFFGGEVILSMTSAGDVDSDGCSPASFITVTVETAAQLLPDCNATETLDECDVADGTSLDCQPNGIPDECDIASGNSPDDNGNGVPDECGCTDDASCDDGDVCNGQESCVSTECVAGNNAMAGTPCGDDADSPCTAPDSCDGMGLCEDNHAPDGEPCDDGIYCNGVEICEAGVCVVHSQRCSGQGCVEATQSCVDLPKITCQAAATVQELGSVKVELFLTDAQELRGYQSAIEVVRTTGSGGVDVDCASGIFIDLFRSDFVFAQRVTASAVNCEFLRVVAALNQLPTVSLAGAPAYIGTYVLDVSQDATIGSTFEVRILPDESSLANGDSQPIEFTVGPNCVITVADCVEVDFGDVAGLGGSCGTDGIISLLDILAVLNAFAGDFASGCGLANIDLVGPGGVCGGDGQITLADILAVLDAFVGSANCPNPCVAP